MRKFHMFSAKRIGFEDIYDYYPFPTEKFTKDDALALFVPEKRETLKNNNRWYEYTCYLFEGEVYYKVIYDGVYNEDDLIKGGYTKEELDLL